MDDETKLFLVAMESRMTARINDQHERLIERMNLLGADFRNSKAFLIEDAIGIQRHIYSLEDRIAHLEKREN